jgi:hypothetical protein
LLIRSVAKFALAAAILTGSAAPALAQDDVPAKTTLMGGYSFMVDRSWQEKLPQGLVAALGHRFNETGSYVFEISGQRGRLGTTPFFVERWAFLGGFKLQSTGGGEALMPFVQVLVGLSRQAGDPGILHGFIVQGGGGVDLKFRERWSLRAFADYRLLRERALATPERWNQYRVGGGVVYSLRR